MSCSQGKLLCVFCLGIVVGFLVFRVPPSLLLAEGPKSTAMVQGGGDSKPATQATKQANAAFAKNLPFADKQAFADWNFTQTVSGSAWTASS
jgi:hypothetical protein